MSKKLKRWMADEVRTALADADAAVLVGFKTLEDGRKVRTFRSTGEVVDV